MELGYIVLLSAAIWIGLMAVGAGIGKRGRTSFSLGDLLLLLFLPMVALFVFAMRNARQNPRQPKPNTDPDAGIRAIAGAWKKPRDT